MTRQAAIEYVRDLRPYSNLLAITWSRAIMPSEIKVQVLDWLNATQDKEVTELSSQTLGIKNILCIEFDNDSNLYIVCGYSWTLGILAGNEEVYSLAPHVIETTRSFGNVVSLDIYNSPLARV